MILGQGRDVRDSVSGLEDGRDLYESCAVLGRDPGRHTSRQGDLPASSIRKLTFEKGRSAIGF